MGKLHYREGISEKEKISFARYLAEDEELVLATGVSQVYLRSRFAVFVMWPGVIFMVLGLAGAYFLQLNLGYGLLAGLVVASLAALIKSAHIYHSNRYLLTSRRLVIKKGVFAVQVTSALYDKITHIEVEQSFADKLLMHHGTIIINTAGMNKGEITLNYVEYPMEFKNLMERLINREREQYGLRGGPVVTLEGEVVS
ncbi:MAG: PH domain-containing protein [Armatimonadetes bacterium]|nr:MAG: PH domain-containing protein [Armatimonadota bacterium]